MKTIIRTVLMLLCSATLFTACNDDRDSNPIVKEATTFVLNTPAIANTTIDLANSTSVELTCTQPNYGFPASTEYVVQVALDKDMTDFVEMATASKTAKIPVDAAELASQLTILYLKAGKTQADFPMNVPVYLRLKANMLTAGGEVVPGTEILSNVITLSDVHLRYSLPPVKLPTELFIVGQFCGWDWGNSLSMIPVNGTDNVFWHMVYIDGAGIKFNTVKDWNGTEVGYAGIKIDATGELSSEIIDANGNIASSNPGWYLMITTMEVKGRDVVHTVTFNRPNVYLMGPASPQSKWDELMADAVFTIPTTATGDFVSPAFSTTIPVGDASGLRAYVKVPGFDWWKSEFMLFNGKIVYRGNGGDQDRVAATAGQRLHLNFNTETGKIE